MDRCEFDNPSTSNEKFHRTQRLMPHTDALYPQRPESTIQILRPACSSSRFANVPWPYSGQDKQTPKMGAARRLRKKRVATFRPVVSMSGADEPPGRDELEAAVRLQAHSLKQRHRHTIIQMAGDKSSAQEFQAGTEAIINSLARPVVEGSICAGSLGGSRSADRPRRPRV